MILRALLIVLANAIFLVAVLWYAPIDSLLMARGYAPNQIAALESTPPDGQATATGENAQAAQTAALTASSDDNAAVQSGDQPHTQNKAATTQSAEPTKPDRQQLVATDTINIRSGPDTSHDVVGQVHKGDVVTVVKAPGGKWVRVHNSQVTGWTYRPLFKPAQ